MWAQKSSEQKKSQRSRRKYLSEEIVRNSSDESEDDSNMFKQGSINTPMGEDATPQPPQLLGGKAARQPPGACDSCRRRRQKCDRTHPECGRCVQLGFQCKYGLILASTTLMKPSSGRSQEEQATLPAQSSPRLSDSEDDTTDQLATDGALRLNKFHLLLDKDWDEEHWQYFYLRIRGDGTMLATMRSLGLKVTRRMRNSFRFAVENFVSLCKDVCEMAEKLCTHFSAAELISLAADPSYLDQEIDVTLDTYSHVWSVDADRTKLLAPGSEPLYPKHLSYEDDDDRKL